MPQLEQVYSITNIARQSPHYSGVYGVCSSALTCPLRGFAAFFAPAETRQANYRDASHKDIGRTRQRLLERLVVFGLSGRGVLDCPGVVGVENAGSIQGISRFAARAW